MENFLHFHLLISIIFSILFLVLGNANSLSPLNSTYIMQVRKYFMSLDPTKLPDPPMPSYTFTVYHRDVFEKSKFKDYDSLLENRFSRSHARASYLTSILESKNGAQGGEMRELVPKSTDIFYGSSEYIASFLVGSQMIRNFLLIDTGSDLVWWQCGPCEVNKCYKQGQPLYVSSESKTFRIIGCNRHGQRCGTVNSAYYCNYENFRCSYDMQYGDKSQTKGFIAEDVITFLAPHWPVRIKFGCSKDQTGELNFSSFAAGIVGLGRKSPRGYSLPSQFGGNIMSMCLPTFNSGKGSVLSFHTSEWPRAKSAKLLYNYKYPSFYFVNLYKVFINDREVPVSPSWWNFKGQKMSGGMIVDTGTSYTYFPRDYYTVFRYIFRAEVKDIPMAKIPVKPFDTCYEEDPNERDLNFPVVKLYFGSVNSSTMLLLAQERVVEYYHGLYCLAFVGWDRDQSVIGMNQLQGVGLTFDTLANTLSFDIDACD